MSISLDWKTIGLCAAAWLGLDLIDHLCGRNVALVASAALAIACWSLIWIGRRARNSAETAESGKVEL